MKPREDLFRLIKSMTPQQKRSFKLYAKRYSDDQKKYIALFEAMHRSESYDEELVKQYLAGEVEAANFASLKNRLWQMLKEFMTAGSGASGETGRGYLLVQTADILQKRGLVDAAKRELRSAEILAQKLDLIDLKLQVNEVRRNLTLRYQDKKLRETIDKLWETRDELLEIKREEEAIAAVYDQLAVLMREDFDLRPKANQEVAVSFLSHDLLSVTMGPRTFRGQRLQKMSRSFCYHILGRLEDELKENEELLALWNRFPSQKIGASEKYRVPLCNCLHVSAQLGRYEAIPALLQELEGLPLHNEDEGIEAFSIIGLYRLIYFMNQKDIASAKRWVETLVPEYHRLAPLINPSIRIGMLANFAIVYFLEEDRDSASHWLRLIQEVSSDQRIDLQCLARIIGVLISIDEKLPPSAESGAKSTQEWLRSKGRLLPFEKTVLKSLRTMAGKPVGEWGAYYPKILKRIEQLQGEQGAQVSMVEVQIWCQARIRKVPMHEILAEMGGRNSKADD